MRGRFALQCFSFSCALLFASFNEKLNTFTDGIVVFYKLCFLESFNGINDVTSVHHKVFTVFKLD